MSAKVRIVDIHRIDTPDILMHIAAGEDPQKIAPVTAHEENAMLLDDVKGVVGSALQIGGRAKAMDAATPLLGAVPELDSIAVVNLITALEEHFGITVADDEIGASTFETLGTLAEFVQSKLSA